MVEILEAILYHIQKTEGDTITGECYGEQELLWFVCSAWAPLASPLKYALHTFNYQRF